MNATTLTQRHEKVLPTLVHTEQHLEGLAHLITLTGDIIAQVGGATYAFSQVTIRDPHPMEFEVLGKVALHEQKYNIQEGQLNVTGYREHKAETQFSAMRRPYVDPALLVGTDSDGKRIELRQVPGTVSFTITNCVFDYKK